MRPLTARRQRPSIAPQTMPGANCIDVWGRTASVRSAEPHDPAKRAHPSRAQAHLNAHGRTARDYASPWTSECYSI
jgi:hypothetical protein